MEQQEFGIRRSNFKVRFLQLCFIDDVNLKDVREIEYMYGFGEELWSVAALWLLGRRGENVKERRRYSTVELKSTLWTNRRARIERIYIWERTLKKHFTKEEELRRRAMQCHKTRRIPLRTPWYLVWSPTNPVCPYDPSPSLTFPRRGNLIYISHNSVRTEILGYILVNVNYTEYSGNSDHVEISAWTWTSSNLGSWKTQNWKRASEGSTER